MNILMPALGSIGTFIFLVAYLPQIIHLIRVKNAIGISILSWTTWSFGAALLLSYALYTRDSIFIAVSGIELICLLIVIFLSLIYNRRNSINRKGIPEIRDIKAGIYRHYKGAEVEVIGVALHSETLEEMVIYRHLTGEHGGETHHWVRPRDMFLESVKVNGIKMPRFEYLRDSGISREG